MSTLLLLACTVRAPTPPAAPVPEPVLDASPARVGPTELVLVPEDLSWDEAAGTVTFAPGSRRMAAEYDTYVLDLASVLAVLGARPTEPVQVKVELGPPEEEGFTPTDPNLPAPQGGFRYTTWRGKVTGRVD